MYVSEICAEGIFLTFPWWLENVKSRSKIALFPNERHFEIWFPKERTITLFWSKLSKLHKKDPLLHVATTFSLKQGATWTSHGPIPHPLTCCNGFCKKDDFFCNNKRKHCQNAISGQVGPIDTLLPNSILYRGTGLLGQLTLLVENRWDNILCLKIYCFWPLKKSSFYVDHFRCWWYI